MRKTLMVSMVAAVALAAAVSASMAAEVTVGADVVSAYVWRGLTFNDGLVVQPSIDVAHPSGLGFNVWGNFDINDYDGAVEEREFSEVDLTISYTLPIEGPVSVTIGITEFLFPKEGNFNPDLPEGHPAVEGVKDTDTREVFLSLGFEPVDNLSLGVNAYYDIDEVEGAYGDVGIAYNYDVTEQLSVEAGAKIGVADKKFAEYYAGGTDAGLFDWGTQLAATYAASECMDVGAFIAYASNIDKDVFPNDARDIEVFGGVSLAVSF